MTEVMAPFFNDLPKDWQYRKFGDILAEPVRNGIYKEKEFHGRGHKMVNMGELFAYDFISGQEMRRIELNGKERSKYLLEDGDLLFARRSLVLEGSGKCSLVVHLSEEITFESSIIRARPNKEEANPRFYCYFWNSPLGQALRASIATRTAVSGIRGSDLVQLEVPVPPLPTQRKIAAILSAYDDLIENNTRRIAVLEEMAQAIYREWFVHFRFPGHEQVAMVDSELGLVPERWEVGELEDALVLQRGFDLPRRKRRPGNVPVYAATGITDTHNEAKIKAPGVVTGRSGSLGTVMYVEEDFWPLNTTLWVREFRRATPLYAYYLLSDMHLENYNSGAAVPTLNRNDIHGLPVVLPPTNTLEEFDNYILPLFEMRTVLRSGNDVLRDARDLLLPRLISGQLDVADLDIAVPSAS